MNAWCFGEQITHFRHAPVPDQILTESQHCWIVSLKVQSLVCRDEIPYDVAVLTPAAPHTEQLLEIFLNRIGINAMRHAEHTHDGVLGLPRVQENCRDFQTDMCLRQNTRRVEHSRQMPPLSQSRPEISLHIGGKSR